MVGLNWTRCEENWNNLVKAFLAQAQEDFNLGAWPETYNNWRQVKTDHGSASPGKKEVELLILDTYMLCSRACTENASHPICVWASDYQKAAKMLLKCVQGRVSRWWEEQKNDHQVQLEKPSDEEVVALEKIQRRLNLLRKKNKDEVNYSGICGGCVIDDPESKPKKTVVYAVWKVTRQNPRTFEWELEKYEVREANPYWRSNDEVVGTVRDTEAEAQKELDRLMAPILAL